MNEAVLKYRIYKVLLESNITQHQRELMVELGLVQSIMSFFKGAGKGAKKMMSAIGDEISQEKLGTAQKNIAAAVEDLRDIAKKAGKDDAFVNALLQQVLQAAGADTNAVATASPEQAASGQGKEESTTGGPLEVTPKSIAKTIVAAPLIAASTDQDVNKVIAQVEEQKPDAAAITSMIARAAAEKTGVDEKIALKALQALIKSGRLKKESRSRKKLPLVFERWQQLAGFNHVLSEADDAGLPAAAAEKEPTAAAVKAASKEVGIDPKEAEKYKQEAEKLAKELKNSTEMYKGFKGRVLQAMGMDADEFDNILIKYGVEAAITPLIVAQKKGATTKPMGTPAKGSPEFSKTIREAIPAEELDDASLAKLADYYESLIQKADGKSKELAKTQPMKTQPM